MRQASKFFINSLCIMLLICGTSWAQVKIKERVEIAPVEVNLQKGGNYDIASTSKNITFEFEWDKPAYNAMIFVEMPYNYDIGTGWQTGGSLSITVPDVIPPVNFMFQYRLNTLWYDPCNVNYRIYVGNVLVKSGSKTHTATSSGFPYGRVAYDFDGIIYDLEVLQPEANTNEVIDLLADVIPASAAAARLNKFNGGSLDFNFMLEVQWTKTNVEPWQTVTEYLQQDITVSNESIAQWTIPWNGAFSNGYSSSTKLTVTTVADGEEYKKVISNPYKIISDDAFYKFKIYKNPGGVIPVYEGNTEEYTAYAYKGIPQSGLPFEYIPAETKFNLEVTEGIELGAIHGWSVTGSGTEFYDIDHSNGRIYFEYAPTAEEGDVTIKISTTDDSIEPVEMKLALMPHPLLAKAVPDVILPGQRCKIVLQVYDKDAGGYVDFDPDHIFDTVDLWDGWWYGDLYSYYEDEYDYWFFDTPGPFDFVAFDDVFTGSDADKDEVIVDVKIITDISLDGDGNPLPTIAVLGDKRSGSTYSLSQKEKAKKGRRTGKTRNSELMLKKGKGKGKQDVLYKKDNLQLTSLDRNDDPMLLSNSITVEKFFEIKIRKEIDKDTMYVKADFEEETLIPGDTVDVVVKRYDTDGNAYDFPQSTLFEIGLLEGCSTGKILSPDGQLEDYFESVQGPLRFVVSDTPDEADTLTKLRVGVPDAADTMYLTYSDDLFQSKTMPDESSNLTLAQKSSDELENVFCVALFNNPGHSVAEGKVEENVIEILLGETKYFGVKIINEPGGSVSLQIVEIQEELVFEEKFPDPTDNWVKKKSIWQDRPIDTQEEGKSPVFYDFFYPTITYTGTTRPVANDLPAGMIRVIGRYWDSDDMDKNKVNLFTNKDEYVYGDSESPPAEPCTLSVQVIKPSKLGDGEPLTLEGPTENGGTLTYNLDELMIEWAGTLGVAPQILKGIAANESKLRLAYRYEPFADMEIIQNYHPDYHSEIHRYWIQDENNLGFPSIPVHDDVYDALGNKIPYPGYINVWDYYVKNKSFFALKFYSNQKKKWDEFFAYALLELSVGGEYNLYDPIALQKLYDDSKIIADLNYEDYLMNEIGGQGMVGIPAQTRIAASYGPMQLTYFSKFKPPLTEYNYPDNDLNKLPEYINIPKINVEWASKHLLGKIRIALGSSIYFKQTDTWPESHFYELTIWKGLKGYNGGSDYPNKVLNKSKDYPPKK